jgi:ABC-type branched-subunit amino acid transport system ATPase component/branched-subunit amino acid ABC-type transport system permease component
MSAVIAFALLGLGAGAVYAALSLGLVVTYKGTGVINFAAGAMAAWGTYTFDELHRNGRLVLPIPVNGHGNVCERACAAPGAAALTIVSVAAMLGLAYLLVIRPCVRRRASTARFLAPAAAAAAVVWTILVWGDLRGGGDLLLPLPPFAYDVGHASVAVALIAALLCAGLLGLLVHLLVFRPLHAAPPLAKVVASVGLMVTLQALIVLRFGSVTRSVDSILPSSEISLGSGIAITSDRLLLGALAVALAVGAWSFYRFTRTGLAVQAAAEDERAVALARYSPSALGAIAWVGSTVAVTLLCILAAPLTGLSPVVLTLMVVPALACALVGRLRLAGATAAAGLGLGILQSEVTYLTSQTWWPQWAVTGLSDAVPFVVLIVVLSLVGRSLPTRDAMRPEPLPRVIIPRNRPAVVGALALAGVLAIVLTSGSYRYGVITSMIVAIAALSIVVVTGLVGQISLAQAAIAGCAGFVLSKLAHNAGIPFPWSPVIAVAAATALGVVVGIPALRVRGAQLAVVTLATALALQRFVFENSSFVDLNGNPVPDARIVGVDLSVSSGSDIARVQFGLLVLAVLVAVTVVVGNLIRSTTGWRLLAVRDNERAAASAGINVAGAKVYAFALASALAGIAGCLLGYSRQQISADSFSVFASLSWFVFAYLGGITSVSGALVAGTFAPLGIGFVLLDRWLHAGDSYTLISGVALILTTLFNPHGVVGAMHAIMSRIRASGRSSDVTTPSSTPGARASRPRLAVGARARAVPSSRSSGALLDAGPITVAYGGVVAVSDVSLHVHPGEIVGLIGPNGAGKTSLIDALTGFTAAHGRVRFDDQELDDLPAHERARRGLRRTWQNVEPFAELTVRQNLQVATVPRSARSMLSDLVRPSAGARVDAVDWALDLLELEYLADSRPDDLSLGHQKLLGVARAVAAKPKLVLLDEPAAGLDSSESILLGRRLAHLAGAGIAVLLIDHDMALVLGACDYVYVMDAGVLIAEGTPAQVRADRRVIEAYLGWPSTPQSAMNGPPTADVEVGAGEDL